MDWLSFYNFTSKYSYINNGAFGGRCISISHRVQSTSGGLVHSGIIVFHCTRSLTCHCEENLTLNFYFLPNVFLYRKYPVHKFNLKIVKSLEIYPISKWCNSFPICQSHSWCSGDYQAWQPPEVEVLKIQSSFVEKTWIIKRSRAFQAPVYRKRSRVLAYAVSFERLLGWSSVMALDSRLRCLWSFSVEPFIYYYKY